jgi:hypothetical protein
MAKTWSNKAQLRYMELVQESHKIEREMAQRLRKDAALDGCIYESQYFLIEDALGTAYRRGAIDALAEGK